MTPVEERIWDRAAVEAGNLPLSWYVEKYGEKKMTVDLSKMKVGDEVLVKGTFDRTSGHRHCIFFGVELDSFWFSPNSIVSFSTPKYEPKAGDVVEYEQHGEPRKVEILATHAAYLWVKFPDDSHGIFKISDLKNLRKVGL